MKPLAIHGGVAATIWFVCAAAWALFELGLAIRVRGAAAGTAASCRSRSRSLGGMALGQFVARRAGLALPGPGWWPVALGVVVFVLGLALRVWAVRELGRFFKFTVVVQADHQVVDTGPYRLIRHPSYTGLLTSSSAWDCARNLALDSGLPPAAADRVRHPAADGGTGPRSGARGPLSRVHEAHRPPDSGRLVSCAVSGTRSAPLEPAPGPGVPGAGPTAAAGPSRSAARPYAPPCASDESHAPRRSTATATAPAIQTRSAMTRIARSSRRRSRSRRRRSRTGRRSSRRSRSRATCPERRTVLGPVSLRRLFRSRTAGEPPISIGDPRLADWETVAALEDEKTAVAWRDHLRSAGLDAACVADHPLDRFGRGDVFLVVPPDQWSTANEIIENLD